MNISCEHTVFIETVEGQDGAVLTDLYMEVT